jgi:hypothetical protein
MKKAFHHKSLPLRETPIERIFREEAGRVMNRQERIIFLGRATRKAKPS